MRAWTLILLLMLVTLAAVPAEAQGRSVRVSIGNAFSQYLEEGGGNAPVGAYLSIASAGKTIGFEADVPYHHDSEDALRLNRGALFLVAAAGFVTFSTGFAY